MEDQHIQSRGHMIWLACIICPIITGVFVLLRAYARIFITRSISWSDWVCFVTLVWTIAFSVTLAQATYTGMGRHEEDFTPELTKGYKFWILVSSVFYVLSLAGYKAALVLLYLQIFGISRKFRYTCYVVLAYTMGYLFCNLIVQIAGCTPVEKFWDKKLPGHCTKSVTQNIAFGVGHMSSDLLIALLPLPMIWKLQLRGLREKVGLFLVLGSGVIAWIVAVVRFTYATVDLVHEDTYIAGVTFFLSVLEVNTGLICGCTPALKPLFISIKESSYVWSRKMSSSYDTEGKRKNSGSYFSRKRSGGDPNSPGGNSLHHAGEVFAELKNVSGSGNSSSNSASNSRRPTLTGANTSRTQLNQSTDAVTDSVSSRVPMPRNPGSDGWNDYTMSITQEHEATSPNIPQKQAQHPFVQKARLGAPEIPHMDSDELFQGYAKTRATDDVEAQQGERERPYHRHQQSNPTEHNPRDFLAHNNSSVPQQPPSQPHPSPTPNATSNPSNNPSTTATPYPLPQPPPHSTQDQQINHHTNRAQILLDQSNRPPSDRRIPTLPHPPS